MLIGRSVCFLFLLTGTHPVAGQIPAPRVDPEEINEVLQDMETAGQVPSAEDQREWTREAEAGARPGSGSASSGIRGGLQLRGYRYGIRSGKWDCRLIISSRRFTFKGRGKWNGRETSLTTGFLAVQGSSYRVMGGHLGLTAGYGLLLGAPGRSPGLAADSAFRRTGTRLVEWTGLPDERTVRGMALEFRYRGCVLNGMGGYSCRPGGIRPVRVLSLAIAGQGTILAACAVQAGPGRGLSLWGRREGGFLAWSGETVFWQVDGGNRTENSWQTVLTLRPERYCGLQAGLARRPAGPGPALGRRSQFLGGQEGRGWAGRIFWRSGAGFRLDLLAASAEQRKVAPEPVRTRIRTWDFIISTRPGHGTVLSARLRAVSRGRWIWSDRFRWLPAIPLPGNNRVQGQVRLVQERNGKALAVTGKWLCRIRQGDTADRFQFGISGRMAGAGGFLVRAGYGSAWGDPLDLVGAISPLPGLVLSRHWGRWRSETYVGLGYRQERVDFWLALAGRRAGREDPAGLELDAWLQVRLRW